MRPAVFDSTKKCDRANRALQECLVEEANRLLENQEFANALTVLYRAYTLRPGAAPVLHSMAPVYAAMGDQESATACRRGVIPVKAEIDYFNATANKDRLVSARRASNTQHRKTHRPEKVTLSCPPSNGTPGSRPEFRARHTESRGSFVSILSNGKIWFDGYNTIVLDSNQAVLKEHIKGNAHLIVDVARHRPERRLTGRVCFLDARSASIYYHWMIDVLPKFALLEAAGISLDSIDHFMVRCDSDFQSQTLQRLGVPMDRIVPSSNDGLTSCQELIVPYLKHDRGDRFYNGLGLGMAKWVPHWLAARFAGTAGDSSRRLYISRASRGTRSPIEESRLVESLIHRGFQSVTLETLSVAEQASLMSCADIVVAPHGAGLTNIAFCKPGTTIVELFGDYVVPCYWSLATLADLNYHAYFVKNAQSQAEGAVADAPVDLARRREQMIDLDVDDFIAFLDQYTAVERLAS